MTSKPIISVILPAFNAEQYLSQAIDSILSQTLNNLELIIIDDGSKDNTLSIIEHYKNKDNRIKIITRENRGLSKSLNDGIEISTGDWIARMDADDISHPERLEKQLLFARKYNIDICGTSITQFGNNKNSTIHYPCTDNEIKFQLNYKCPIAHPTTIIRKALFKSNLYSTTELSEDYELWCRFAMTGARFANISYPYLNYRIHPSQISDIKKKDLIESVSKNSSEYRKWYKKTYNLKSEQLSTDIFYTDSNNEALILFAKQIMELSVQHGFINCDVAQKIIQMKVNSNNNSLKNTISLILQLIRLKVHIPKKECAKLLTRSVMGKELYNIIKAKLS